MIFYISIWTPRKDKEFMFGWGTERYHFKLKRVRGVEGLSYGGIVIAKLIVYIVFSVWVKTDISSELLWSDMAHLQVAKILYS